MQPQRRIPPSNSSDLQVVQRGLTLLMRGIGATDGDALTYTDAGLAKVTLGSLATISLPESSDGKVLSDDGTFVEMSGSGGGLTHPQVLARCLGC
jgi:hypothetical protein